MKLERLQRWHLAIAAVIVGVALAQAQLRRATTDPLTRGNFIDDPQRFESWLLRQTNGQPWLRDVVVHPSRTDATHPYVVTATRIYNDGGAVTRVPITFVPSQPYKPQMSLDYLTGPAASRAIERLNANPGPTFLDYLAAARAAAGVSYRYAWWEEPWKATAVWTAGALLLIAGLWPTLINLIVYHRLTRPPPEPGIELSKVKVPRPAPAAAQAPDLAALEQELASRLDEFETGGAAADLSPSPAPVRALVATASEPALVETHPDAREFGAKPDDYYPTPPPELWRPADPRRERRSRRKLSPTSAATRPWRPHGGPAPRS
jgi:hypothetical protein